MTTDELVDLAEALVGETTVRDAVETWNGLDDYQLALLVRFVAGERPSGTGQPPAPERAVEGPTAGNDEDYVAGPHFTESLGRDLGSIKLF